MATSQYINWNPRELQEYLIAKRYRDEHFNPYTSERIYDMTFGDMVKLAEDSKYVVSYIEINTPTKIEALMYEVVKLSGTRLKDLSLDHVYDMSDFGGSSYNLVLEVSYTEDDLLRTYLIKEILNNKFSIEFN